jgi:hypothetical protein
MSEVTVYEDHDDGFGRPSANDRLLRGTRIGWTDTNKWVDRDGMPPPDTMIVIAVDEALQKWQGKKVVEVIRDKPLSNVNTLNEATDKNTWEIGLDNKPKPPWEHSYFVYLLDPATATTYTYVNSTYGAKLAYDAFMSGSPPCVCCVVPASCRWSSSMNGRSEPASVRVSARSSPS